MDQRFLSGELSDCDVVFCLDPEHAGGDDAQADDRVLVGDPLPAHVRVLCDGSERFPAELERWRVAAVDAGRDGGGGGGRGDGGDAGATCSDVGGDGAAGTTEARPAKRQRVTVAAAGATGGPGRPQFTVGLWAPGERRLAEALLRFMYCGVLHLRSMPDLLRARPVALRLMIKGGVQACDGGVRAALAAAKVAGKEAMHAAVVDLYHCRAVLPEPADAAGADPTGPALRQDVLGFSREALVAHCKDVNGAAARPAVAAGAAAAAGGAAAAAGGAAAVVAPAAGGAGAAPAGGAAAGAEVAAPAAAAGAAAALPGAAMGGRLGNGGPPLGELLAFAFESVAAALALDRSIFLQILSLPLEAMEALLASEGFATDDEASVLVLVACWCRGRRDNTLAVEAAVLRLLRHIRWPHVDTFLLLCAPLVPWMGMSWQRAAWLRAYAQAATPEQRAVMERRATAADRNHYRLDAPGHRVPRRPAARPQGAMTFSIPVEALVAGQQTAAQPKGSISTLFVARGFTWWLCVSQYGQRMGVALDCYRHDFYGVPRSTLRGIAFPGKDVILSVLGADGEVAHSVPCGSANSGEGVPVGGEGTPLLLLDLENRAAEGEARWARYLRAGKLHIRLEVRS
ncbi:hypothetical protein HXX76_015976 [Chlamydomonas incerta]|uniref:BACK domain-containing protein n=1 Tax=Chlamydomonas incerta TaxID=51695 RepID=A0A835SD47_CHLIN|nr:hypothetical protein HXX76_015976 [Chlamydomonas incerta]|eukprot:KAG2422507.1 hypothetical protein HXX76_015976 [Chlamydomonas incerta]